MKITKSKIRQIVQEQFDRLIDERQEMRGGPRIAKLKNILANRGLTAGHEECAEAIIQAALVKVASLEELINVAVKACSTKQDQKSSEAAAFAVAEKLKEMARQKRSQMPSTKG